MATETLDLSAARVRQHLLERANVYIKREKSSLSFISQQAVNDSKCLSRIRDGGNFTVETYQRVIDWLDAAERQKASAA